MQTTQGETSPQARSTERGFPDPSITLVEFSGEGLGILLAAQTDRDPSNRRLQLKKVAYIRIEQRTWGFSAFPEVWIQQNQEGMFLAVEAQSGRIFRHPSRRRYEIAFLSKEIFEAGIQCLKERMPEPLYELVAVSFGTRPDFSVDSGFLLAPEDYAAEVNYAQSEEQWVPFPMHIEAPAAKG